MADQLSVADVAQLRTMLDQLELAGGEPSAQVGADTYAPDVGQTVNPDGTISADFRGRVTANEFWANIKDPISGAVTLRRIIDSLGNSDFVINDDNRVPIAWYNSWTPYPGYPGIRCWKRGRHVFVNGLVTRGTTNTLPWIVGYVCALPYRAASYYQSFYALTLGGGAYSSGAYLYMDAGSTAMYLGNGGVANNVAWMNINGFYETDM